MRRKGFHLGLYRRSLENRVDRLVGHVADDHLSGLIDRTKQWSRGITPYLEPRLHGLGSPVVDVGHAFLVSLPSHDEGTGLRFVVRNLKGHHLGTTKTGGIENPHQSGVT